MQADDGVVRILPTGDSLTQGIEGDRTWRYWLDGHLNAQGVPHDFVGSNRRTASLNLGSYSEGYRPGITFDADHEGWGGARLVDSETTLVFRLAASRPDVWILELGTNDILSGQRAPETLLAATQRATAIAREMNPEIRIVLVTVLGLPGGESVNSVGTAFNEGLVGFAQSASTPESPLTVARVDLAVDPTTGTHDGVHLNAQGEYNYAVAISMSLAELGTRTR